MRDLLLWGATGQAKVLHELIHDTNLRLVALVDNRLIPSAIPDVPLLHGAEELDNWLIQRGGTHNLYAAVAVGGEKGNDRLMLMDMLLTRNLAIETLIHTTAFVAHNAIVGEGCQILAQSAVCAQARLGRGVIINTSAAVDHDCWLGNGVHLGPGARLAGEVTIGQRAFIGAGAVILPRISVGEDAIVGAGAVVTKDVAPGVTVIGNPARQKI